MKPFIAVQFPAMSRLAFATTLLLLLSVPAAAQTTAATEAAYQRAAALVREGNGEAGRRIVDSLFVRTREGSPEHAEALFWRAALATDTQQAERDYRQLIVEYPLSPRADRALLALAQLDLARNDRERALGHLQRLEREHPSAASRATAAFWTARIRFDMNEEPRACSALDDAQRLVTAEEVELRNQIEFHVPRCRGVTRVAEGDRSRAPAAATSPPPAAARPAPADRTPPAAIPPRSSAERRPPVAERTPGAFAVQIAAYNTRTEADALVTRLARRNVTARVVGTEKPFRVWTGSYATRAEANAAQRDLQSRGIHGFVTTQQPANR